MHPDLSEALKDHNQQEHVVRIRHMRVVLITIVFVIAEAASPKEQKDSLLSTELGSLFNCLTLQDALESRHVAQCQGDTQQDHKYDPVEVTSLEHHEADFFLEYAMLLYGFFICYAQSELIHAVNFLVSELRCLCIES